MAERSEEARAAGLLELQFGDVKRTIPTLKAKYIPDWLNRLYAADSLAGSKRLTEYTPADTAQFSAALISAMLDLIVAYDRTAGLGGREWLEEHADPAELRAALEQMVAVANPFANAPMALAIALSALAAKSVPVSSTNGASPNGDSTPTKSANDSTPSR